MGNALGGVTMEKVYRLLDWLDMAQAVDWLQNMTSTRADATSLLQLCDAGQCLVYLDCRGVGGDVFKDIGEEVPLFSPANGAGICKVESPRQLGDKSRTGTHVIGLVQIKSTDKLIENCELWVPIENDVGPPLFKPADIEALAAKMNGVPDQTSLTAENADLRRELAENSSEIAILRKYFKAEGTNVAELESLRKQLEQERIKCKAAEAKVAKLQADMDLALAEREATEKRAELAESKPAHLPTIAALLQLLADPKITKRNQSGVIDEINTRFPSARGLSRRNLEDIFSAANKAAKEIE
jgi:hypothetical protein